MQPAPRVPDGLRARRSGRFRSGRPPRGRARTEAEIVFCATKPCAAEMSVRIGEAAFAKVVIGIHIGLLLSDIYLGLSDGRYGDGSFGNNNTMDWDAIFAWIGRAATVAAPIGLASIWFGKTYIDKWLSKRFQGQLDALKHAQAQEIERLRAKIAGMLDRAAKLHQHEFAVLPMAWDKLSTALGAVSDVTASFKEGVDPGRMSAMELEAFLAKGPLEDHQKQAIRDADRFEKPRLYQTFHDHIQFNDASRVPSYLDSTIPCGHRIGGFSGYAYAIGTRATPLAGGGHPVRPCRCGEVQGLHLRPAVLPTPLRRGTRSSRFCWPRPATGKRRPILTSTASTFRRSTIGTRSGSTPPRSANI